MQVGRLIEVIILNKISFGTAHWWPWPLNGGGRLIEGYFIVIVLQIFWDFDARRTREPLAELATSRSW